MLAEFTVCVKCNVNYMGHSAYCVWDIIRFPPDHAKRMPMKTLNRSGLFSIILKNFVFLYG